MVAQMMMAQLLLRSLPEEGQRLELVSVLPIRLPENAPLVNARELSGKRWRVDFGGGNYREARLELEGSS